MFAFTRVFGVYILTAALLTWGLFAFGLAEELELPGFEGQKPPNATPVIVEERPPPPEPKRSQPADMVVEMRKAEPAPAPVPQPQVIAKVPEPAPVVIAPPLPPSIAKIEPAPEAKSRAVERPVPQVLLEAPTAPPSKAVAAPPIVATPLPPPPAPKIAPVEAPRTLSPAPPASRPDPVVVAPASPPPDGPPPKRAIETPPTRMVEAAPVVRPPSPPPTVQPAPSQPSQRAPAPSPAAAANGPRRSWEPVRRIAGFGPDSLIDQLEDTRRPADDLPCVAFEGVRFRAGTAQSLRSTQRQIELMATSLDAVPGTRVEIGSRIGTMQMTVANQQLAAQRARFVHDALVRRGIAPERLTMDRSAAYHEMMADVGRVSGSRAPSVGICVLPSRA